jgi:hypothetical protein
VARAARATIWNNLGAYEEPIRRYLLGETGFPADVIVAVMACTDYGSQGTFYTPCEVRGLEVIGFGMLARGIHFRLFVGPDIPPQMRRVCCFTSPRQVILRGSCRRILHRCARPRRPLPNADGLPCGQ